MNITKEVLTPFLVKRLLSIYSTQYNNYIIDYYNRNLIEDKKDFNGACNKQERELLVDCFIDVLENVDLNEYTHIDIIKALLYYYYYSIIFEYYISNDDIDYDCDRKFFRGTKGREIAHKIILGNEEWTSLVRRKINNLKEK